MKTWEIKTTAIHSSGCHFTGPVVALLRENAQPHVVFVALPVSGILKLTQGKVNPHRAACVISPDGKVHTTIISVAQWIIEHDGIAM